MKPTIFSAFDTSPDPATVARPPAESAASLRDAAPAPPERFEALRLIITGLKAAGILLSAIEGIVALFWIAGGVDAKTLSVYGGLLIIAVAVAAVIVTVLVTFGVAELLTLMIEIAEDSRRAADSTAYTAEEYRKQLDSPK